MEFEYKLVGNRFYPIIPLFLTERDITTKTDALIDSGSVLSFFKIEVAKQLNINYKTGRPARIGSVQGELMAYIHRIKIRVGVKEFLCNIGFSESFVPNLNLLGRVDFFEQFDVTLREKQKKVYLE